MTARALPVVAPEAVTSPEDVIACPKLHAKISAAHCARLCSSVTTPIPGPRGRKAMAARQLRNNALGCEGCPIGPVVLARLASTPRPEAPAQ